VGFTKADTVRVLLLLCNAMAQTASEEIMKEEKEEDNFIVMIIIWRYTQQ